MWMYNCYKVYKKPKVLYFPNKYCWKKELEMSFVRSVLREWMIGWSWTLRQMRLMAGRGAGPGFDRVQVKDYLTLTFLCCSGGGLLLGRSRCCSANRHHRRFTWRTRKAHEHNQWNFWYAKFNHFAKKTQLHKQYCTCGSMSVADIYLTNSCFCLSSLKFAFYKLVHP